MKKDTRNKIAGLNEGIQEELDLLTRELRFRVETITKYKDEILKILDAEFINKASLEGTYARAEKIRPGIVKRAEDKQKQMITEFVQNASEDKE